MTHYAGGDEEKGALWYHATAFLWSTLTIIYIGVYLLANSLNWIWIYTNFTSQAYLKKVIFKTIYNI